jgi:hypothetical protein
MQPCLQKRRGLTTVRRSRGCVAMSDPFSLLQILACGWLHLSSKLDCMQPNSLSAPGLISVSLVSLHLPAPHLSALCQTRASIWWLRSWRRRTTQRLSLWAAEPPMVSGGKLRRGLVHSCAYADIGDADISKQLFTAQPTAARLTYAGGELTIRPAQVCI